MTDATQANEPNEAGDPTPQSSGPTSEFAFSPEREEKFQEIVRRYPTNTSAIMPTLWLCQDEWGYLKKGVPEWVAARLDVPISRIYEVITFYTMYFTENPGKHNLQVCRNVSCHMAGAPKIVAHLEEKLGIRSGETDADGHFGLEEVECLELAATGP